LPNRGAAGAGSNDAAGYYSSGAGIGGADDRSSASSPGASASATAAQSDVVQAQQALKQKGLYGGPLDGKIGPETRNAISRFQQQNGLKQSAQLDDETLSDLQSGSGTSRGGAGAGTRGTMPGNTGSPGAMGGESSGRMSSPGSSSSGGMGQPAH
jgi:peptidoglycan hydrolase-like protein with peptidoglycan-binding domain